MHNSFPTGGFMGNNMDGVWQAVEELRSRFEKPPGTRVGRGDVRSAVLALLAEQPMHGYQIIREIEERSGGSWKPSAGSVYPTLQLLADEGLISAEESNGRKIYSLTDAGREEGRRRGISAMGSGGRNAGHRVRRAAQGRHRTRPGRGPGGPHRHDDAGAGGRGGAGRGAPQAVLDPRPGLTGVASVRSAAGLIRARRGEHPRPLPPHPALRRLASGCDVVV